MRAFVAERAWSAGGGAVAGSAFAAGVQITQPRVADDEFAGPSTVVTFSVDAGLTAEPDRRAAADG